MNGTTAWTTGWMVSTISHVYLAAVPDTLYTDIANLDFGSAKVSVSFPIWAYAYGDYLYTNDATVAPNIVKISINDDNSNRFIGFFVPTS